LISSIAIRVASFTGFSLIAIVPVSEWRIPTFMGSLPATLPQPVMGKIRKKILVSAIIAPITLQNRQLKNPGIFTLDAWVLVKKHSGRSLPFMGISPDLFLRNIK
jgi:hypothetical protein